MKAQWVVWLVILNSFLWAEEIYKMPADTQTRWISFENQKGEKGAGAIENRGAKGHPADRIAAGASLVLMDVKGSGAIQRIWVTIDDRSPHMLRALKLEMFWDGADKPAVSAPFGDFFGIAHGRRLPFENAFFSDPEGRSFNCIIPMPFKTGARVVLTNESDKDLGSIFYDINYVLTTKPETGALYFHAYWQRDPATELARDFAILPKVEGRGRFLGTNIGVITNPAYGDSWWGEGEVKVYLDGDSNLPTLVGTGTEDYIGSAWGQGLYINRYQGCTVAGNDRQWAFYRFHVPDPVYFHTDIKVTIQQMGGNMKPKVLEMIKAKAPLQVVTFGGVKFFEQNPVPKLSDPNMPADGWANFYRSDDVCAAAYFYCDKPITELPAIQPVAERVAGLAK